MNVMILRQDGFLRLACWWCKYGYSSQGNFKDQGETNFYNLVRSTGYYLVLFIIELK